MVSYNPDNGELLKETVPAKAEGMRIDVFLVELLSGQTRSFIKKLLQDNLVQVNSKNAKPGLRLKGGEDLSVFLPVPVELAAFPEEMPLNIVYEDSSLLVINKQPNLVVHPSPGHESGSLVNGLLWYCKDLSGIGGVLRPGIVHRLDRDTSGLLVVAKNDFAHRHLSNQFAQRTVKKKYLAITHGVPVPSTGVIEGNIGRNPQQRKIMAMLSTGGRPALTRYQLKRDFGKFSLIECYPKTGRTHQIRIHLASIGCPVICDTYYGRENSLSPAQLGGHGVGQKSGKNAQPVITRQALHATNLSFIHPQSNEQLEFAAALPADLQGVLDALK